MAKKIQNPVTVTVPPVWAQVLLGAQVTIKPQVKVSER